MPLKYLSNFWRTLEGKFAITETKLYVPAVSSSTHDSAK